jgi:hypothetical protein
MVTAWKRTPPPRRTVPALAPVALRAPSAKAGTESNPHSQIKFYLRPGLCPVSHFVSPPNLTAVQHRQLSSIAWQSRSGIDHLVGHQYLSTAGFDNFEVRRSQQLIETFDLVSFRYEVIALRSVPKRL